MSLWEMTGQTLISMMRSVTVQEDCGPEQFELLIHEERILGPVYIASPMVSYSRYVISCCVALLSCILGAMKKHGDTLLSNGIGWNLADDTLYHIDSYKKGVFSWSYNKFDGSVSNQEILIDYTQDPELAMPDGMCTDDKGRLWVASFGGHRITCWNPRTKQRILTVKIPGAKNVTSCCFGGPNYEWLFVTTATKYLSEKDLKDNPNSGSVFVIKDLGARGLPAYKFKVNV